MKGHKAGILFGLALAAFSVYVALDSFVIKSVWQENASEVNLSLFDEKTQEQTLLKQETEEELAGKLVSAQQESQTGQVRQTAAAELGGTQIGSYEDENASIVLTEYETGDTTVYVADIRLSSAQYLKTAFAQNTYGKNVTATTSATAAANGAILAINGDFYGAQEKGYVIRNGVVYRESAGNAEVLCIYADGHLEVIAPGSMSAQELVRQGVWQAFSFGPGLVEDGEIAVSEKDEVGRAKASNPRTAIGIIDELHYLFVVSDGRTEESAGLSLYELASFLQKLGATTAYNLDGGGSSAMVFQGELINRPTTSGRTIKERSISDIVYIG